MDVLGIGAYDRDNLVGFAACSADCDDMWQIGVDVLPEYRDIRQGLMQHLASFRRSLEEDDNTASVSYRGAGYTQIEGSAFL